MRTLVVSDLHLGSHSKRDVAREQEGLDALLAAVRECDRLILLGDLIEFRHGPEREALEAARGPLSALGEALGAEREVVIVAGNHDHHLLDGWLARRALSEPPSALGLETDINWIDGEPLALLAGWLSPARVRVAYPGLWLRPDVYAIHGHYADLHLTMPTLERLGAGIMRRIVSLPAAGPQSAEDYEAVLAPMYAWIHALAQRIAPELGGNLHGGSVRGWQALSGPGRRGLRRRAMALAFPAVVFGLNRGGLGPLRADLTGAALRRAGLRGTEDALARLGVDARYVIFGHTHRAGPLPGDEGSEWRTQGGAELINSGCWVSEPSFLGSDPSRSPYRVGFAVWVEDSTPPTPPRLVNLLESSSSSRPGVKHTA
jgi:predicted phosphodiesterase